MIEQPTTLPRIIVERQPDGTLIIEQYLDGSRQRLPLVRGMELYDILEALAEQQKRIDASLVRKAAKQTEEEKARHRRIYYHSATTKGQGREFADKIIGPPESEIAKIARQQANRLRVSIEKEAKAALAAQSTDFALAMDLLA